MPTTQRPKKTLPVARARAASLARRIAIADGRVSGFTNGGRRPTAGHMPVLARGAF